MVLLIGTSNTFKYFVNLVKYYVDFDLVGKEIIAVYCCKNRVIFEYNTILYHSSTTILFLCNCSLYLNIFSSLIFKFYPCIHHNLKLNKKIIVTFCWKKVFKISWFSFNIIRLCVDLFIFLLKVPSIFANIECAIYC